MSFACQASAKVDFHHLSPFHIPRCIFWYHGISPRLPTCLPTPAQLLRRAGRPEDTTRYLEAAAKDVNRLHADAGLHYCMGLFYKCAAV